jgi:hypothetical protein
MGYPAEKLRAAGPSFGRDQFVFGYPRLGRHTRVTRTGVQLSARLGWALRYVTCLYPPGIPLPPVSARKSLVFQRDRVWASL